jgi:uncharacterized membrane protein
MSRARVRRAFPDAALAAIEAAIRESESSHAGELRFAVEGGLSGAPLTSGQPVRERAIDVFSLLRMWDTEHRNGVLIYLLLAERAVEIVADRGVHAQAGGPAWKAICHDMEQAFHAGRYQAGALAGIAAITALLARHYPGSGPRRNELPDAVVLL